MKNLLIAFISRGFRVACLSTLEVGITITKRNRSFTASFVVCSIYDILIHSKRIFSVFNLNHIHIIYGRKRKATCL